MADELDEPIDLTNLSLPSRSNAPVETKDAANYKRSAPKSSAQRQREYRQRIAASRTPAQLIATRISDTERKRNYRLRKAANLGLASGSLESTIASSSRSAGRSNDVQNSTQRQLTNQQRNFLAAQSTVQPGSSSDQIEVLVEPMDLTDLPLPSRSNVPVETQDAAASTSATPFAEAPTITAPKSSAQRQREEDEDKTPTASMTSSDTYQLKWHSHSAHLNGSVAALLRSERFTDVVLCTMDGSQIPAHKFILSSCSVYLSSLFDGQRSVMRMGGMLYVVLPSEISTKALKILVEYMYKGETTVSNEVLDTVLKAGEVLKIRGLWRQFDEVGGDSTPAEKIIPGNTAAIVNKQSIVKKPEEVTPKITMKKDDKVIKFNPVQTQGAVNRPVFIGAPKLVFIKTSEGGTTAALRPGTPLGTKGQTILVSGAPITTMASQQTVATVPASNTITVATTTISEDSTEDATPPPRFLRRHAVERKYGKKQKTDASVEGTAKGKDKEDSQSSDAGKSSPATTEIMIKDEPEWDASSIEEEERSIAEMFQQEMSVKSEPVDEVDIDENSLIYSPLACELCAEVFTVPAAWVRHVQGHARSSQTHARKRKHRSASDDTEETMALLRCDLCQKHFPNPAEWVRHIQSTHTEKEGVQNKICTHCKKTFPSHASMLIHMRTHTGERPFVCGLCNKGFNVKSNLLRHLRTLHEQPVSPERAPSAEPERAPAKREA